MLLIAGGASLIMYASTSIGGGRPGRQICWSPAGSPAQGRSTRMATVAAARQDHAHGTLPRRRIIGPARAVCRLTMAINGVDYQVAPNRSEEYAVMKAYRLCKPDGT